MEKNGWKPIDILPTRQEVRDKVVYGLMWLVNAAVKHISYEPRPTQSSHYHPGEASKSSLDNVIEVDFLQHDDPDLIA